jgi:hypothetical protein
MVGSQFFLLIILMVSSAVYCGKGFKEKLCQSNLTADVVAALGKCFEQRPPQVDFHINVSRIKLKNLNVKKFFRWWKQLKLVWLKLVKQL